MYRRMLAFVGAVVLLAVSPGYANAATPSHWRPSGAPTWQIQFNGTLTTSVKAAVYDVDGDGTTAAQVKALHKRGSKVICYVSAGSYEDWRADAGKFPSAVLGSDLDGWPGEKWLDVRRWDVLAPIMRARFVACRAKGFDAVDPDNLDGYANDNGVGLTAADQLLYNRRIASLGHSLGMAVGLKNDLDQVTALQPSFDFAVNEQCAYYRECAMLKPFVAAKKPVFEIEYATITFCAQSRKLGFSAIKKHLNLDAWRSPCVAS